MANGIVGWIGDRGVANFVECEAFTRILHAANYHVTCPQIGDLDVLPWIELPSVLDGVQQHFTKSSRYITFFRLGQICNFVEELQQSLCGLQVATCGQPNPSWRRRKNLDAIVPARPFSRKLHHPRNRGPAEWFREIAEGVFAHRGNDIRWGAFIGENDQSCMWSDRSNSAQ